MPVSRLDDTINQFYRDLAREEAKTVRKITQSYGTALDVFDAELEKVSARIAVEGLTDNLAFQYQRLDALAKQASDEMAEFGRAVGSAVGDSQGAGARIGQRYGPRLIGATIGPGPTASLSAWATLPDAALVQLTGALADGSPLSALTHRYGSIASQGMQRLLLEGVALGRNPLETARLMRDELGVPYRNANTLARTEQMRAFREANRRTMMANQRVVKGWTWFAQLDRFTCPVCWAMHGKQFQTREPMHTHPNCRCTQLPVTRSWKELGFDLPEPISPGPLGPELFDRLPRQRQRIILGPAGATLYERGLVTLEDFVLLRHDPRWGWGRTTRPLSAIVPQWRQLL